MTQPNIPWASAPEGHVWIVDSYGRSEPGWYREEADRYVFEDGTFWRKSESMLTVYRRPVYDGNGIPPVGAKCWFSSAHRVNDWPECLNVEGVEAEIIAHYTAPTGAQMAVFLFEAGGGRSVAQAQACCFSIPPAAEPPELAEIENLYLEGGPAAVYDAGYRKASN